MSPIVVNDLPSLNDFLQRLCDGDTKPILYIDLEGNNLSRHGTLSLMTVMTPGHEDIYIIDVCVLGKTAFSTEGPGGRTLRNALEDDEQTKVFFDVRCDSDALHYHHGICLDGVEDLQLMELAARKFSKRCVNGLAKCIEQDAGLDWHEGKEFARVKDKGRKLFAPERGGTFAVFDRRPLMNDIVTYCAQDVAHMPRLRRQYRQKLCDAWWIKIIDETKARIRLSRTPGFNGQGRHMALGPPSWQHWQPTFTQSSERTMLQEQDALARAPAKTVVDQEGDLDPAKDIEDSLGELQLGDDGCKVLHRKPSNLEEHGTLGERPTWQVERDADSDDDDDLAAGYDSGRHIGRRADSDSERDLTACDSECGYCGKCDY